MSNQRTPRVGKLTEGSKFLSAYDFVNLSQAAEFLVKMCASTGKSTGVQNDEYVKMSLAKADYVITVEDYKESGPKYEKIVGFLILTPDETSKQDLPKDITGKGIHLELVCSRAPGSGKYMLEQMDELAKKKKYQYISLVAVKGVQGVYERRGFQYLQLDDDNLPEMVKSLVGGRRKTHKNGLRKRKTMRRRR